MFKMFYFLFVTICVSYTFAGPLGLYPLENVIEKPKFINDYSYSLFNDILESNVMRNVIPLLPMSSHQIQDLYKTMYNLMQFIPAKSSYIQQQAQQFMCPNGNKPFVQNLQDIYEIIPNSGSILEAASRMTNLVNINRQIIAKLKQVEVYLSMFQLMSRFNKQ